MEADRIWEEKDKGREGKRQETSDRAAIYIYIYIYIYIHIYHVDLCVDKHAYFEAH